MSSIHASFGPVSSQKISAAQVRQALKLSLVCLQHVGEDDELSEVSSGLGASTVDSRHHEQDLAGFPEVEHSRGSAISHVAEATKDEADVPASLVHSPSKFAARGHMGEGQAIGTSVHPSTQDMQIVSSCVMMLGDDCIKQDCFVTCLVETAAIDVIAWT